MEIKYSPGKLAEILSRACMPNCSESLEGDWDIESINMLHYLPVSATKLWGIQEALEKDSTLQAVKEAMLKG